MLDSSLISEFFSLIISLVLLANVTQKKWRYIEHLKKYMICLLLTVGSVVLNMICVCSITYSHHLPVIVNVILNSIYFMLINMTAVFMTYCALLVILEHNYDKSYMFKIKIILFFLAAVYNLIVVANLFTGILFSFTYHFEYVRGPWNSIGYFFIYLEIGLLLWFSYQKRKCLDSSSIQLLKTLPVSVILMTVYQMIYPDFYMNGSIMAVFNIILWMNLFSSHSDIDALTKIGNRRSFIKEIQLRINDHQQFVIVLVSLKRLKEVNKNYGHNMGDIFLYEIAHYLDQLVVEGMAFRYRNIEIALMVPYRDDIQTHLLIDQIVKRFEMPWQIQSKDLMIHVDMAYITYLSGYNSDQFIEQLEYTMALAKTENRIVEFDDGVLHQISQEKRILALLQQAIAKNSLQVWFQPIYDIKKQQFAFAEALLRLVDGDKIIAPHDFIPIAQSHQMMDDISWFVIEKVCAFLQAHPDQPQCVSVNLSMQQLENENIVEKIQSIIETYDIDPHRLRIEVTEQILSSQEDKMFDVIHRLNDIGIQFCLDDFGTGYSNVASIIKFPLNCIKIDRSLIQGFPYNSNNHHLIDTLIRLLHHLQFKIVVEGVENVMQYQELEKLGVDYIQGFYFSKPLNASNYLQFMKMKK